MAHSGALEVGNGLLWGIVKRLEILPHAVCIFSGRGVKALIIVRKQLAGGLDLLVQERDCLRLFACDAHQI